MRQITVRTPSNHYPILIGAPLSEAAEYVRGSQALVVTQANLRTLYANTLCTALRATVKQLDIFELPLGEQHKNLAAIDAILTVLLEKLHNRTTTILALGGGVVGDVAGFAAACYQRGVDYIQIPTTLLAQVDSSVGGKTAVNHSLGKNMIGAFYQPQAVIVDTTTLRTLPPRELAAGMAEVIKYGLIGDKAFLDWLAAEDTITRVHQKEQATLDQLISISCQVKADVVAADEREAHSRALLNLGHTFGHAIEAFTDYKTFLHGEAVAIGIMLATHISHQLEHITDREVAFVNNLLQAYHLPFKMPTTMRVEDFLQLIQRDKKTANGQIRLILLRALGDAYCNDQLDKDTIQRFLEGI